MIEAILQHQGLIGHHFNGILLTAGLIALFTLAEISWPAAPGGEARGRLINILIGLIVSVFAFICTALIAWLATMVWRDGLIGRIVPEWRAEGIAGLMTSVVVYGSCGISSSTGSIAGNICR